MAPISASNQGNLEPGHQASHAVPSAAWIRSAWIGAVAVGVRWLFTGVEQTPLPGVLSLLLIGSAIAVPLALSLVDPTAAERSGARRWVVLRWSHLPASLLLLASASLPEGLTAGLLSLPWLAFTFLVAVVGLARWMERLAGPWPQIAIDAGLVFLVVGGAWCSASRFGAPLLGFHEPWVVLTAAHFHFAGLVLPVVTGLVATRCPGRAATPASVGVVVGVPLVAAGITAGAAGHHTLEWSAAMLLVIGGGLTAFMLSRAGRTSVLLGLSGLALFVGLVLVVIYSTGILLGRSSLDLTDMMASHAVVQVFGFAMPALVAFHRLPRVPEPAGMELLLPLLGDSPSPWLWEQRPTGAIVDGTAVLDALDRHEVRLPANPDEESFRRAAEAIAGFRVFPKDVLQALDIRDRIRIGDTVRVRYRLLPGLHVVFAARVIDVFDDLRRSGFTYRTLVGHPLSGDETFAVERQADGSVFVSITALSRPNTTVCRLLRFWVRRLQTRAGLAGAARLAEISGQSRPGG